jgi:hypothetical protein
MSKDVSSPEIIQALPAVENALAEIDARLECCEHCGEEAWLDLVGEYVDFRPCCEARQSELEAYGFEGVYGCTIKEAMHLRLGLGDELREVFGAGVVQVKEVPLAGGAVLLDADLEEQWEDSTRARFPLEERINHEIVLKDGVPAAQSAKGWQGELFAFVQEHHSHHDAPQGWKFGVAVDNGLTRVGVATVGRPVSRKIQEAEPFTLEVTRVCVAGHPKLRRNACSKLYSLCCREAKRLGAAKLITYTLLEEDAMSLKSSGWVPVAMSKGGSHNRSGRPREDKAPTCPKVRWEKVLDHKRATALPPIAFSPKRAKEVARAVPKKLSTVRETVPERKRLDVHVIRVPRSRVQSEPRSQSPAKATKRMTPPGRKHTAATKRKMSESKPKRPVIAVNMDTRETRTFESTRAAADEGFASSNIIAACKGRLRHYKNHFWRYADEFESIDKVFADAEARPSQVTSPVVAINPKTRASKHYPSIKATEDDGYDYDSVMAALIGRSRRSGGMFWRYAEDFTSADEVLAEETAYDEAKRKRDD